MLFLYYILLTSESCILWQTKHYPHQIIWFPHRILHSSDYYFITFLLVIHKDTCLCNQKWVTNSFSFREPLYYLFMMKLPDSQEKNNTRLSGGANLCCGYPRTYQIKRLPNTVIQVHYAVQATTEFSIEMLHDAMTIDRYLCLHNNYSEPGQQLLQAEIQEKYQMVVLQNSIQTQEEPCIITLKTLTSM